MAIPIVNAIHYLQPYNAVIGVFMPTEQAAEQFAATALQAPINSLIVFGILLALVIVIGGGFLIYKFMPIILKQIQQLIDNNSQLTHIAQQNASQAALAQQASEKTATEIVKQTGLLTDTKGLINEQNILLTDFKNYQKLNNDQVTGLTTAVEAIPESVAELKADISKRFDDIDLKLAELLSKSDCADMKTEWDVFRQQFFERLDKPISAVSNIVVIPPANVSADTPPASEQDKAA